MFGLAHYLIKQLQQSPLLVRYELRVTDNVDEEHIGDLQFDLFFNLRRHPLTLPKNQPIDNLIFTRTVESTASASGNGSRSGRATCSYSFNPCILSRVVGSRSSTDRTEVS